MTIPAHGSPVRSNGFPFLLKLQEFQVPQLGVDMNTDSMLMAASITELQFT